MLSWMIILEAAAIVASAFSHLKLSWMIMMEAAAIVASAFSQRLHHDRA